MVNSFLSSILLIFAPPILCIVLGILTSSFWVALLAFLSILLSLARMFDSSSDSSRKKPFNFISDFLINYFIAVILMGLASYLADYEPWWILIILWAYILFSSVITSINTKRIKKHLSYISTALAFLTAPIFVGLPNLIRSSLSSQSFDGSTLAWTLVLGSLAILLISQNYAFQKMNSIYLILIFTGFFALIASTWVSNFQGGWWWILPWFISAFLIGYIEYKLFKNRYKTGYLGILISIFCIILGIFSPLVSTGVLTPEEIPFLNKILYEKPSDFFTGSAIVFIKAIGCFLWKIQKSFWGAFHLLIFLILDHLWMPKKGGYLSAFLLLFVGYLGVKNVYVLDLFISFFTSSPKRWLLAIMESSFNLSGTIGWGIIITSLAIIFLFLPEFYDNLRSMQKPVQFKKNNKNQGKNKSNKFNIKIFWGKVRSVFPNSFYIGVNSIVTINLWLAIRELKNPPINQFSFLFIPNLSEPHLKPVWHSAYFVVGMIFLISFYVYTTLRKKKMAGNPFFWTNPWYITSLSIIAALFIPAGVVLYLIIQVLLLSLIFSLVRKDIKIPTPDSPKKEVVPTDKEDSSKRESEKIQDEHRVEEIQPPKREEEDHSKVTIPKLIGSSIHKFTHPIIGAGKNSYDQLFFLDAQGNLFILYYGVQLAKNLPFSSLKFLLTSNNNKMLAINEEGMLVQIGIDHDIVLDTPFKLDYRLQTCALNSYGTLLAFVPLNQPTKLKGMFLMFQKEQDFLDTGNEEIFSICFSQNARFLGIGTKSGKLITMDIATHQVINDVPDMGFGSLQMMAEIESKQWVALYQDGWLATWAIEKSTSIAENNQSHKKIKPVELVNGFSSLAIYPERRSIIVGDQKGFIWTYPYNLSAMEYEGQVQEGVITHIFTTPNGGIFTIGNGIMLRGFDNIIT